MDGEDPLPGVRLLLMILTGQKGQGPRWSHFHKVAEPVHKGSPAKGPAPYCHHSGH